MATPPDRTGRGGTHARSGSRLRPDAAPAGAPQHSKPVAVTRVGTRGRPGRTGPARIVAVAAAVVLIGGVAALFDVADRPRDAAAGRSAPGVVEAPTTEPAPAGAPGTLEELLRRRAEQNLLLLRSTLERDADTAALAARGVDAAGEGLSVVLSEQSDAGSASRIRARLDEQSEAGRSYARAVASADTAGADRARGRMAEASSDLGNVLAGITGGRIAASVPPQDAGQYRAFVDALAAGDMRQADLIAAWLRGRSARQGVALAG